jgi:hypothetical protein
MIPRVYSAITAVAGALAKDGIAKERLIARDDYFYRSIDDVMARLSPLLAEHRLCILPRVLERTAADRQGENGDLLVNVCVRVAFDLVSAEDASVHTIEAVGEALDAADKGTAKAMQSAYKYALLQAFCVPVSQAEDADARSHRLKAPQLPTEPAEGWAQWAQATVGEIRACSTPDELDRLQDDSRSLLASLSREQPQLYRQLGEAIGRRRAELALTAKAGSPASTKGAPLARAKKRAPVICGKNSPAAKPNGSGAHA